MGCCNDIDNDAVVSGKIENSRHTPPNKCLEMITEVVKEQAAEIEDDIAAKIEPRVSSLNDTALASGTVVEAVGVPTYVDDVTAYADFSITEKGWYVFASVKAEKGVKVTAETTVEGAASYIAATGEDHVDVAVRFDVASMSVPVTISWDAAHTETFVFKATDLAVRNLDYRTTFYVYDITKYRTWSYALTADTEFVAGKNYFVKRDGVYTPAEVTAGEAIPAGYYVQTPAYALTTDSHFAEGTNYYIKQGDEYVKVNVTIGDPVAADTYYVQTTTYIRAEGEVFEEGTTYYTLEENVYTPAEVTAGEAIPNYYVHSKLHFEGMARNVTYNLTEIVDCPIEIVLPEIPKNGYGAWFDIQMRYDGTHSCTLLPPEGVKIGTAQTQSQTKGVNIFELQYTDAGDVKMWTLLNTHSNIPS